MERIISVPAAFERIKSHLHQTQIVRSGLLNQWLGGHEVFFKCECQQKVGAFKARGALNAVLKRLEYDRPSEIIANSSGNHAQAVAWASRKVGIPATIYMTENVSVVKRIATESYGAKVVLLNKRSIVDEAAEEHSEKKGVFWIPPYNHDDVIEGQGTVGFEIMQQIDDLDAVFAPCGGGGLLSGLHIATSSSANGCQNPRVIGVEPEIANDAYRSLQEDSIYRFQESPDTLADGARTLSVGDKTFPYLKKLDGFYTVNEERIAYWTQWLTHLLKLQIEPTSAMSMEAAYCWLKKQKKPMRICIVLSGGNVDLDMMKRIWDVDYLHKSPSL